MLCFFLQTSILRVDDAVIKPEASAVRIQCSGLFLRTRRKVSTAVDTFGLLLALHVTPATEQGRAAGGRARGGRPGGHERRLELAYVNRGCAWEEPAAEVRASGTWMEVVKHPGANKGFVLLPRRLEEERSFCVDVLVPAAGQELRVAV